MANELIEMYEGLKRAELSGVVRDAESMKYFAGADDTFVLGEWSAWRRECMLKGKMLPPADFKHKVSNG